MKTPVYKRFSGTFAVVKSIFPSNGGSTLGVGATAGMMGQRTGLWQKKGYIKLQAGNYAS